MKYILSGTNRPGSRSLQVCQIIKDIYDRQGEPVEIMDLAKVGLNQVDGAQYSENKPPELDAAVEKILKSEGITIVVPEYNGSMPGILKYFLDHWKFPDCFEYRPVCFVGLGGRFGGLRPVEHLEQVFGYRNAFIFPERVFLMNVWTVLQEGKIQDEMIMGLLEGQAKKFCKFANALKGAQLDANTFLATKEAQQ